MKQGTAVALGNFDGLHTGHMKVLQSALSSSGDGVVPVVLLFDCHPLKVLNGTEPPYIMTAQDRDCLLRDMGFCIVTESFDEICNMTPQEFVETVLCEKLCAKTVCCGYNYRFGKGGSGDAQMLKKLCEERSVNVIVANEQMADGESVSSTRIRRLIESGDVETAGRLLGRAFGYNLTVIHGNKNGRQLGFPTANQAFPDGFAVPKYGVYASRTTVDGKTYRSITNIGVRPTIEDTALLSETHIIGFDRDLYGEKIKVELLRFIREERKFNSLEEVFSQVREDIRSVM